MLFSKRAAILPAYFSSNPIFIMANQFEDLFKKFVYTGVGFVSTTAEKLQESVDDLVGKGKLSKDEGKRLVDDFFQNTEARRAEFETKMKEVAEGVMDRVSVSSRNEEETLTQRLDQLEARLARLEATDKPAPKKVTSPKKTAPQKSTSPSGKKSSGTSPKKKDEQ